MSQVHDLKCWPEYFAAVIDGTKTFEVRHGEDRNYQVGDTLRLREWSYQTGYTGRETTRRVTYILRGEPFLPASVCVMALAE